MIIGVDFDNTIVCYDQVFHQVALERGFIDADVPVCKGKVRDNMRANNKEGDWTRLQGYVYGTRMNDVEAFRGALEFFSSCANQGVSTRVISHKTRYPYAGERYDLHQAARKWLQENGFFDSDRIGMPEANAFFELTKEEKLLRIAKASCTHFIDDLPEFLGDTKFPPNVKKILFDPNGIHKAEQGFTRVTSWTEITRRFLDKTEK